MSFDSKLGKISIGNDFPCFVVAEMSANHNGNLQKARSIIYGAASAGANAIKLQTYLPETMTIDCEKEYFKVQSKTGPQGWNQSLYNLYQSAHTPWEWHREL
ncbi:MAG: N-acetylneuraminate synthase family protein, partial [Betaproteobacteria bacterium]